MNQNTSIPVWLAGAAEDDPDRTFAREVDGRTISYGAFQLEAWRWAAAFRSLGVRPHDTVVTMTSPTIDSFAAWIGLSWLRAVDVGCNTDYRGRMLVYLINNAMAKTMVVGKKWLDRLIEIADQVPRLETVIVADAQEVPTGLPWRVLTAQALLADASPALDLDPPAIWDTAMMVYTSGTTGPSKGVCVPWGQQYENAAGVIPIDSIDKDDVYYSTFPMFHSSGRIPLCLMAMARGCFVIRQQFSATDFWKDVRAHGCTTTGLVGAMATFLWNQPPKSDDADNPLQRAMMLPVLPQWRQFEARFGIKLRTGFALTEVSPPFGTGWNVADFRSCGKLRPGYEVRLVDEHDLEVPPGQTGELVVRHERPWTLSQGYFGMPEQTAQAWRNGWFHTGDSFRRDDELNYYFVDRIKDAIRRRGENISSFEVEALVNAHTEVAESAAIAIPSEHGEDEVKIVVVRVQGSTLSEADLIRYLIRTMPRFMVPRYVEFADRLPRTDATLRIKKIELRSKPINDRTWDREQAGIEVPR